MNNFVQRIYKMYVDIGTMNSEDADKYCQKMLKKFKKGLDETKQRVFMISNRQGITDIKIITTYLDENNNMYYTVQA